MPDMEKVIKGLECCSVPEGHCEKCPYETEGYVADCTSALATDALELLKEQKQKAVRPTHKCVDGYSYITDPYMVYCPYCGKPIIGRKNIR